MFPIADAAAPIDDTKSKSIAVSKSVEMINADMKKRKNPNEKTVPAYDNGKYIGNWNALMFKLVATHPLL